MTEATALRPDRMGLGIGLILISTLFTSLQDAVIKGFAGEVTLWQIYVLRSVLLLPALLGVARLAGVRWRQVFALWPMLRAGLFLAMYFALYAAIPVLPLAVVAAGIYTAPLFVAGLSALVLGERVRPLGWLAIGLGFAGVLVILKPGSEAFDARVLVPVLAGFFYALSALATRGRLRGVPPVALALALAWGLLAAGLVGSVAVYLWPVPGGMGFLTGTWGAVTPRVCGLLAVLAALMLGNGLVLPAAYQAAPVVVIATFDYAYLIWAALFGVWFFGEVPEGRTMLGMVMIAGAGGLVARA